MDYLDPKKQARHKTILFTGYVLIGLLLMAASYVLLNQTDGFVYDKKGNVIQNGKLFISSSPNPAKIYLNGKLDRAETNSRLTLPEDIYNVELRREGYQTWTRTVSVEGGRIHNFDYPLLIPNRLSTTTLRTYDSAPSLATQSPDRRWIVVAKTGSFTEFDVYDTRDIQKAPVTIELPENALSAATANERLEIMEWSADNSHLIVKHYFNDQAEFILLDREDPAQSINLTQTLPAEFTNLSLVDRKYDRYYALQADGTLLQMRLGDTEPRTVLKNVIDYQSYAEDTLLYATADPANKDKVLARVYTPNKTYTVRSLPAGAIYLLDLTKYDGVMYVIVGASTDNRAFIYKDPMQQINRQQLKLPAPMQVLRVVGANFVSFSSNTQYVMIENGTAFAVYDLKEDNGYSFTAAKPLDAPQTHANWMDGNRITYISEGKHYVFEYDSQNPRTLSAANPSYMPFFSREYDETYTVSVTQNGASRLIRTPLLTTEDQ